ncbi:MAG TPA: hypothetical protein VJV79_31315 [Polyangiaceae bacterium]|nr:hypothetical protein [Polyangiaceae bacterium]
MKYSVKHWFACVVLVLLAGPAFAQPSISSPGDGAAVTTTAADASAGAGVAPPSSGVARSTWGFGDSDERPRLYLVAEGEGSAVPERFLWSLCDLIKADPNLRLRYKSVGVYRIAPEALEIAKQRAREPDLRQLSATRDLLESADKRFAASHFCFGEPDAAVGAQGDMTSAELLWLEWMGGAMSDELRAQYGRTRRSTDGSQDVLDKPKYLRIPEGARQMSGDESARRIARELARQFLDPHDPWVFDAKVSISIPPEVRCGESDDSRNCAQLGVEVKASLELEETIWATPAEVSHRWKLVCEDENGRSSERQISNGDARARTLIFLSNDRSICHVKAILVSGPHRIETSPTSIRFEAPSVLVQRSKRDRMLFGVFPWFSSLDGAPVAARWTELELYERRWVPWGRATLKEPRLRKNLFVLQGAEVVGFGRAMGAQLSDIALPLIGRPTIAAQRELQQRLDQMGDGLGYRVLDGLDLCEDLQDTIIKHAPDTVLDTSEWRERCYNIVGTARAKLSTKLRAPSSLVLARDPETSSRIYKGVPALTERQRARFLPATPIFASRIEKPYRPKEKYLLAAMDPNEVQSRPVPVELKLHVPSLTVGYGMAAVYVPHGGGLSIQAFAPFLANTISLRLEYLQYLQSIPGAEGELDLNLAVSGAALISISDLLVTLVARAESPWMILELGPGGRLNLVDSVHRQPTFYSSLVMRAGIRVGTGLGDTGQEYRFGLASWADERGSLYQLFFEFSIL